MPLTNPPALPAQQNWLPLTLQNGWQNFGGNYAPARCWKDSWGVVRIEGVIKNGTAGAIVATLPAGYRPEFQQAFATAPNDNVAGRFLISTSGAITHLNGASTGAFLIGMHFRAA